MVISTVTYSLEIYTPDTNVKHLLRARVEIVGEEFMQTGRKTVIPGATTPETETQGYVTYQTQRLCLTTFPNTEKEVDNMAHRGVFMVNF